ncbi:MAG: pyridoxamine 5'-phosphate oxidase family protein [Acidimicrobiaceae bacterium]|nr:pyridoxamine 5'-phosphate oxidase family protein [Acidimicrobiaceae bacterium]MYC40950.1 pyridoxamine 5'-phosphate oxidase family protein [Acidimicrobiaceae bacterium]MYH88619.1 pyridoxamine 5'-phosphate oxidase family protein [Acidimicrobiaceae bacterium]
MAVTNQTELRSVYREPMPRAAQKVVDRLDVHCRKFIALSPFCIVSSTGVNGRADASPRGDHPGFVQVLDDRTLLIPDRPGNNQVDSLQNILVHPVVGLLFLVPGMNETLRVCGTAEIVTDPELLAPLAIRNRVPVSGLRITITDAFLHCGRALLRARLWDPEAQIDRGDYPTYGQVLANQIAGANAQEIDASEDEANREQLY